MKRTPANFVTALTFFLVSNTIYSAPVITDIAYDGLSLKVDGSGFGNYDGEILSWDDFDNHPLGVTVEGLNPVKGFTWSTLSEIKSDKGVTIDDSHVISGKHAAKVDWGVDGPVNIRAFGWAGKGPYNQLYITYWRRMEGNYVSGGTMNHKQFYVYGDGSSSGLPELILLIPAGGNCWGANGNYDAYTAWNLDYSTANNMTVPRVCWEDSSYKFNRWEIFVKLNQPETVSNGILEIDFDAKRVVNNQTYPARNVPGNFKDFRLGHMAKGFNTTAKAWFDDVYVSTTRQRIEVCNTEKYADCTIKHIQFFTMWSDNSITVTLRNLNHFKNGDSFLYVINKDGVANEYGIRLPKPVSPSS